MTIRRQARLAGAPEWGGIYEDVTFEQAARIQAETLSSLWPDDDIFDIETRDMPTAEDPDPVVHSHVVNRHVEWHVRSLRRDNAKEGREESD